MAQDGPGIDPDIIEEDIGGVQGSEDGDESDQQPDGEATQAGTPQTVPDEPAPDGAEIEWAGAVVKKPPTPTGLA